MTDSKYHFSRVAADPTGYYYARWDRSVPVEVIAEDEQAARKKVLQLSPMPPARRVWRLRLNRVEAIPEPQATVDEEGESLILYGLTAEQRELLSAVAEQMRGW